jgi:hypothetical protein
MYMSCICSVHHSKTIYLRLLLFFEEFTDPLLILCNCAMITLPIALPQPYCHSLWIPITFCMCVNVWLSSRLSTNTRRSASRST